MFPRARGNSGSSASGAIREYIAAGEQPVVPAAELPGVRWLTELQRGVL